jgi:hypothetical protein
MISLYNFIVSIILFFIIGLLIIISGTLFTIAAIFTISFEYIFNILKFLLNTKDKK